MIDQQKRYDIWAIVFWRFFFLLSFMVGVQAIFHIKKTEIFIAASIRIVENGRFGWICFVILSYCQIFTTTMYYIFPNIHPLRIWRPILEEMEQLFIISSFFQLFILSNIVDHQICGNDMVFGVHYLNWLWSNSYVVFKIPFRKPINTFVCGSAFCFCLCVNAIKNELC